MSGERGFTSVLQKQPDMDNPDYRQYLEQAQALEGSYPEAVIAPLARSALGVARQALTPKTTLYRAEALNERVSTPPAWLSESQEYKNMMNATGRWFTDDLAEAQWYLKDVQKGGNIYKVKVPTKEAEAMRVSNLPPGHQAKDFSRRQEKEFFVPKKVADSKTIYE